MKHPVTNFGLLLFGMDFKIEFQPVLFRSAGEKDSQASQFYTPELTRILSGQGLSPFWRPNLV